MYAVRVRVAPANARRRAAALVEFVICLPVLVSVALATVQTADVIHLKQTLKVAGYEAARYSIRPDSTAATAEAAADAMLDAREIGGATVTFQPADVANAARGTDITVFVSAPVNSNCVLGSFLFGNNTLTVSVTMSKE